jgi:hypothetical protein
MGVIGQAIARHLVSLRGLYSVELPEELNDEIVSLVNTANAVHANRGLFVSDVPLQSSTVRTVRWSEVLGWRTEDDRIFAWKRGLREPDTSFRSVVRPFISSRFPGTSNSECSQQLFVRLCMTELWRQRNESAVGEAFDDFVNTADWVFGVIRHTFERIGSTPTSHWSDRFLGHCAGLFERLGSGLSAFQGMIESRHAWEIVRLSGLPLPAELAKGNPFLAAPEALEPQEWPRISELWDDIVNSFVVPQGGISPLLSALDHQARSGAGTSPWRQLPWTLVQGIADQPSVALGAKVFSSQQSPSLLSAVIPAYPVTPSPAWWGVSTDDLKAAMAELREQTPMEPVPGGQVLLPVYTSAPSPYILNTRLGTLSFAHTARKWRARVAISGVHLRFKAGWRRLHVCAVPPSSPSEGDAWVQSDAVEVSVKGAKVENVTVQASPGDQLLIDCALTIEYNATKDAQGVLFGAWKAERNLTVRLTLRQCFNGAWDAGRELEMSLELVIPSPFAPTTLVTQGNSLVTCSPDNQDSYTPDLVLGNHWTVQETPSAVLDEEGPYEIHVYDGRVRADVPQFDAVTVLWIGGTSLGTAIGGYMPAVNVVLDDGVTLEETTFGLPQELIVFKVKERSGNLSSGLLSAVRGMPAGRKQPSTAARQSVLGRYQDNVVEALRASIRAGLNSLYQYCIPSSGDPVAWRPHSGLPAAECLMTLPPGTTLVGIGDGPSQALVDSPEWRTFMHALGGVCSALGIRPGEFDNWLSGFDFSAIPAASVRKYVVAHCALIRRAKEISDGDCFWASYPLSVFVVEGKPGFKFGQLQAVMLSPLHPVRFGWAYSVATVARMSAGTVDPALLSLAEGWNIPIAGWTLNAANQRRHLAAIPVDPGSEQDFIGWSALAVLNESGVAELPVLSGGQPLPWGGRTGINSKVVERAVADYLAVHPHVNAFQVEIRSVSDSPRSQEIDCAVMDLIGGAAAQGISELGGGIIVWDSEYRHGTGPTRDHLFAVRGSSNVAGPFQWRTYPATQEPSDTDLALIENASVHVAVVPTSAHGVVGSLPIRRFSPAKTENGMLDQSFSPRNGEDLLGICDLLREMEGDSAQALSALRASPQAQALGVRGGANWEVLGTFNLDPALLSTVIGAASSQTNKRLLWEWRPSWMPVDRKLADLARRPYYVIARVPSSLLKALQQRQGHAQANAEEMLEVLGLRGIGLAALNAKASTAESAAAGFFYALQLLSPPSGHNPLAQATSHEVILGTVPVDPVESLLEALAGRRLARRADLLQIAITRPKPRAVRLCFVPVEVKHHGMPSEPEALPAASDRELKRARQQLADTAKMISDIAVGLANAGSPAAIIGQCLRRVAVATLVDLSLSFMLPQVSVETRADILDAIVSGEVTIGIGDSILLWFSPGLIQFTGGPCVVNTHGTTTVDGHNIHELFIDPSSIPGLWWRSQLVGAHENTTRTLLDAAIVDSFRTCSKSSLSPALPASDRLAAELGLVELPTAGQGVDVSPPPARGDVPEAEPDPTTSPSPAKPIAIVPDTHPAPIEELGYVELSTSDNSARESLTTPAAPDAFVGWSGSTSRWSIIGKLHGTTRSVALDFDHPKTIGIFGYMGSGKSYLLGNIIESASQEIAGINCLGAPLAVVVFNYRRNAADRFELSSLTAPNSDSADVQRLQEGYGVRPAGLRDVMALCLPGELSRERLDEYGQVSARELFFDPKSLGAEDWELLMGEPGSEAVFARTIRNTLVGLRAAGDISLEALEEQTAARLTGQSRTAATLRFDFVRRYISEERGTDFASIIKPGRVLIVDLRQPLFNKEDALRFFLVCANQISRVQGAFNKMIVFDEAHEYLSESFGERMESRIRLMRHEGTSYVFATQDVASIPDQISRFLTTRFVFDLGTRENVNDLERVAPDFKGFQLAGLRSGRCFLQSSHSTDGLFSRPREVEIRPRVTQHGGRSQIFSNAKNS